jgi:ABC-type multidrug transport system ATPase subunit
VAAAEDASIVALQGVAKRYGRWAPEVLTEVSLELAPAEVIAVVGPNGSGKTTLLRLLAGVTQPSRGRVRRRARVVGYVAERFPVTVPFTVAGYLTHMGRIRRLEAAELPARIRGIADRLGLGASLHRRIPTLSKGTRQKAAIAQALLAGPDLLVMDEPWSGLDAEAQAALNGMIAEVAAAGGAVAFTDHRESVVEAVAGRVLSLRDGRLVPAGCS